MGQPCASAMVGASRMSFHGIDGNRQKRVQSQSASNAAAASSAMRAAERIAPCAGPSGAGAIRSGGNTGFTAADPRPK